MVNARGLLTCMFAAWAILVPILDFAGGEKCGGMLALSHQCACFVSYSAILWCNYMSISLVALSLFTS